jgi:hypothetical protein
VVGCDVFCVVIATWYSEFGLKTRGAKIV